MNADLKGALKQINRSWPAFEHKGERMTREQVKHVLTRAIADGYETTADLSDQKVDSYLLELQKPKEQKMKLIITIDCETAAEAMAHLTTLRDQIHKAAKKRKLDPVKDELPLDAAKELSDNNCYGDHEVEIYKN